MKEIRFPLHFKAIHRFKGSMKIPAKIVFIAMGMVSTLWFLFRVIPKPSRATYPCMKAAAPVMSSFIIYLVSITGSIVAFRKFREKINRSKYIVAAGFLLVAMISVFIAFSIHSNPVSARMVDNKPSPANSPVGTPTGIFPGRVVWVWNPDATNENMTNTEGDYWYQNTDAAVVQEMLDSALIKYTLQPTVTDAWDALFKYFNNKKGNGETGYSAGEKFMIKINLTNSYYISGGTAHTDNNAKTHMDQTPELMLAVLQHLVDEVGVAQTDITIGDPYRTFRDEYWDVCHSVYPDVNYCDGEGLNGRVATVPTSSDVLFCSDGTISWPLPESYMEADYFINMSCLKTHNEGGITLGSKNHQGSIGPSAMDMHYSLPANDEGYGKYRHLVDYMGHENMGGNTVLSIVDGIWAGKNWEGIVEKWGIAPFNDDYPNSVFISQDPVAIESVCYDFLYEEYSSKSGNEQYPMIDGAIDFLAQAASPANWPSGITYDPEDDGSTLGSLGVYEHWNNVTDKQYTVNLTGSGGIHLVSVPNDLVETEVEPEAIKNIYSTLQMSVYPNPATEYMNIEFNLEKSTRVSIDLLGLDGKKVKTLGSRVAVGKQDMIYSLNGIESGLYMVRMMVDDGTKKQVSAVKVEVSN